MDTHPGVPLARSVIPMKPGVRTGGWSQSGKLAVGGPGVGNVNPATGDPVEIVSQGLNYQVSFYDEKDPRGRPAQVYTLTFDVDTRGIAMPQFRKVRPFAEVVFATEGNTVSRAFNIVNGTSISGVCEHMTVRVQDQTQNPGGGNIPVGAGIYTVSMLATPGTRPQGFVPPISASSPLAELAAGLSSVIAIPDEVGAQTVIVYAIELAGAVAQIEQRDAAGSVLAVWNGAINGPVPIPLVAGATDIRIENVGAAGVVRAAVAFGVDG
jgi:hypothetical protein